MAGKKFNLKEKTKKRLSSTSTSQSFLADLTNDNEAEATVATHDTSHRVQAVLKPKVKRSVSKPARMNLRLYADTAARIENMHLETGLTKTIIIEKALADYFDKYGY